MGWIVAIDGPAGAGKSAVTRRVAEELALTYIDTGAMYRSLALCAMRRGVSTTEPLALAELATQIKIEFSPVMPDGIQRVFVDAADVTSEIRTPQVSQLTSTISAFPEVRSVVVAQQRSLAASATSGVALEGRDIGTVVFPNADLKIFLTAGEEERARRRFNELRQKGVDITFERALEEQRERDRRDSEREASPLKPAHDSVMLNTDGMTIAEVVHKIVSLSRDRQNQRDKHP